MNERQFGARPTRDGTSFRLWAPAAKRVDLLLQKPHPMQRGDDGWFAADITGIGAGARYKFRIDDEVERRQGTCRATRNMTVALPAATWKTLGVRTAAGEPLPEKAPDSALVSGDTRAFLVNHNYDALIDYNCSHAYAITVALLADSIAGLEPPPRPSKARKPAKTRKHPKPQ